MGSDYIKILDLLWNELGFNYKAYKMSMLVPRIDNRVNLSNCNNTKDYLSFLKTSPDEKTKLKNNFLINVSQFFRDPMVFEFLYSCALPEQFYKKPDSLRIWSAGCAAGEEPYSFSILLEEYFLQENISPDIFFFATDSDRNILEEAKKGIYTYNQVVDCKLKFIDSYFHVRNKKYHVNDKVKTMVNFSYDDLLDKDSYAPRESIFGGFDIIFCRNVLIYFNDDFHERIFEKLYRSLVKGGLLVLGEAETIPGKFTRNFIQLNNFSKIYRRLS